MAGTLLEIDLGLLAHNYRVLRGRLRPGTRFLGVVKAFAYGSDMVCIARKLEQLGADYLAVAYVKEGVLLREAGVQLPIMVLHPQSHQLDTCIMHCLEPTLYSLRLLKAFLSACQKAGVNAYPVHLKFNTGLNRLGFWAGEIDVLLGELAGNNTVRVATVLSHLAATDDMEQADFTRTQISRFDEICESLFSGLEYQAIRHICNTSGIFNFPEAQYEMVRSGIGLYGFGNDPVYDRELRPIARLYTEISQIHRIGEGDYVGYNMGYQADSPKTVATLPLGHADGIGRHLGQGKGGVWIHGRWAPVLGWVCMDMIMVDISGIPCTEGDRAVVFDAEHPAEELADKAGTISYEILTSLGPRVERRVVEEESGFSRNLDATKS